MARLFRTSLSNLKKRLDKIENKLLNITQEISTTKEVSIKYWSKLNSNMHKLYEESRIIFSKWMNDEMPYYYDQNIRKQIQRIKNLSIKVEPKQNFFDLINSDKIKQSKKTIINNGIADYITGTLQGEKTYLRLINVTQQLNINEKRLNAIVKEGDKIGSSTFNVRKNLQKQLLKNSIEGKYIRIIDKNGKPRDYNLKSYSELVARTKLTQAQTESVIQTAANYDTDLVQVSSHNTETAYDAQFEGKIFSLTGNNPNFPPAIDLPPFHPNCRHTITVVFEEALKINGSFERLSEFSKGAA